MAKAKKCGFKTFWQKIKNIKWKQKVNPVIGYSLLCGVLILAVLIGTLVICL